jgi:iron complex outermembrane receptor protein
MPPAPPAPAASADKGLGQVVVTGSGERQQYRQSATSSATRTETPLQELPQSVQVVSRQLMDDLAATRLDDVLLYVSGVAKQNNFGGLWDNYSIRGFSGSDNGGMNILWNGFASNRGYAPRAIPPMSRASISSRAGRSALWQQRAGRHHQRGHQEAAVQGGQFAGPVGGQQRHYRGAVDSTGALNSAVAYRLNAAIGAAGQLP